MKQYLELMEKILTHGEHRPDRTGTGTISLFGEQLRFDLSKSFPLLTTKKMFFKGVAAELIWFLSGSTNTNDLPEYVQAWWKPWADSNGNLGPIYGHQLRNAGAMRQGDDFFDSSGDEYWGNGVDQIQSVIDSLRDDPFSRRHVISTWAPKDLPHMGLAPCHGNIIQFYVSGDRKLSCHMYQRSGDYFIGVSVNIASYALLTLMLCQTHGFSPGDLVISFGDVHIYKNHIEQCKLQLSRQPRELPQVCFNENTPDSILEMKYEDFTLSGYNPWPPIKGDVSV